MGCANTREKPFSKNTSVRANGEAKSRVIILPKTSYQVDYEINANPIKPVIGEEDIRLVRESWDKLHSDMVRVGVVMFTRLFETHPDVQDAFMDFRHMSIEDVRHSKTLREHGLRVMTTVEKVLARIDDPEKLDVFIQQLGSKHITYKANQNYIQLVGPQFVKSIKSELQDVWTPETEKAWYKLFDYITYFMKQGMATVVT